MNVLGSDRSAARITKTAVAYATHGWPVAAMAVPRGSGCPCGDDCDEAHLVSEPITSAKDAEETWAAGHPWDIALVTANFDVVELPPPYGSSLYNKLTTACPTMTVWRGRTWRFVVAAGTFPEDLIEAADGALYSGADDWIATAPSRLETVGRLYWVVGPRETRWRPYRRTDAVDQVFAGIRKPA